MSQSSYSRADIKRLYDPELPAPTKDEVVLAYVARDVEMKLTGTEYFTKHLKKLGYTPQAIIENKENIMRKFLHEEMDKIIESGEFYQFETLMNRWRSSHEFLVVENQTLPKQQRYGELMNFVEGTNEEFYSQLTLEELIYLGF